MEELDQEPFQSEKHSIILGDHIKVKDIFQFILVSLSNFDISCLGDGLFCITVNITYISVYKPHYLDKYKLCNLTGTNYSALPNLQTTRASLHVHDILTESRRK